MRKWGYDNIKTKPNLSGVFKLMRENYMKEVKTEELLEVVAQNAEEEFNMFKNFELAKEKVEIFEDNYKIRFYDEIHEYLISENLLNSYELTVMISRYCKKYEGGINYGHTYKIIRASNGNVRLQ